MRLFYSNRLYTHRAMLDTCIRVVHTTYEDAERIKLKIEWFRMKDFNSMGFHETVTIDKADLDSWREVCPVISS